MTLPVLISVPHGGSGIPEEVADRVCLDAADLFADSDPFTLAIYDIRDSVVFWIGASIARAFVDLNRAPDDRPPANPDGVVKTATCYSRPIYRKGMELTEEITEALLRSYYFPYHSRIEEAMGTPPRLALDCHSMAAVAPPVAPDQDPRPLFCLSNGGGSTAPQALMLELRSALATAFNISLSDIRLNDPFRGGHITRFHGSHGMPWIQVEMNRSLYLRDPWFDPSARTLAESRVGELRDRFLSAIETVAL